MPYKNSLPCAASTAAGSSPTSLLLTSMLLRGVVLLASLLLLRLSDTLSAGWAAVEDGAPLAVRNCRSQCGRHVSGRCSAACRVPNRGIVEDCTHPASEVHSAGNGYFRSRSSHVHSET